MNNEIKEQIKYRSIIAAVKCMQGLESCAASSCGIVFILFGNVCNISEIVDKVKQTGKTAFVHMDLIEGLANKEIAIDFLKLNTKADGIITTKASLIKYAKSKGFLCVQRFFLIDSMALENMQKQMDAAKPDLAEVLPGVMPTVIKKLSEKYTDTPIIAGGLITAKEDIMAALKAGASAVSSTNEQVWFM